MPEPGIGFELECRTIRLANDAEPAKEAGSDARERVRGKEILVGDKLTKVGKYRDSWTLTASLVSSAGIGLICADVVVHGPDFDDRRGRGQGVKLCPDNSGVTAAIGEELQDFLENWSGVVEPISLADCAGYGRWTVQPFDPAGKMWDHRVTAPVPLAALHAMFPVDGPAHPFVGAGPMVRVAHEDLPAAIAHAGHSAAEIDRLLGYLSLVVTYIARGPEDTSARGLDRLLPVMPRTDFAAMARSCEATIAPYGSVLELVAHVCEARRIEMRTARFHWRSKAAVIALPVIDWLDHLPKIDLVAEHDRSFQRARIGGLGATVEHLIGRPDVHAPIFEFRTSGCCPTAGIPAFMARAEREVRRIHAAA
jgi:hypothetical protein